MKKPFLIFMILAFALSITSTLLAQEDNKLRINGYITAAYAISDSKYPYPYGNEIVQDSVHISNKPTYSALSRYGIQFLYDTGEDLEFLVQIKGSGQNEFKPETDWAMLKYKFTDSLTAKMGKLRLPFYLYSDTLEVSYTYPWLRPPYAAYNEIEHDRFNFNSLNGIDVAFNWQIMDDYELLIELISGEATKKVDYWFAKYDNSLNFLGIEKREGVNKFRELNAVNLAFSGESFTFKYTQLTGKGSYIEDVSTDLNPGLKDYPLTWSDLAFRYDDGSLLFVAEQTKFGYAPPNYAPLDIVGAYATIGYRFGRFMPHITYSTWKSKISATPGTIFTDDVLSNESTTALGLRTEINDYASIKLEYHKVTIGETSAFSAAGKFGYASYDGNNPFLKETLKEGDTVNMYMAGVDMVF